MPAPAETTFTDQFDHLAAVAHRVAFRILGDRHVAEELAQEALVRAYARWRTIRGYADAWVAKVTGNLAIDVVRKKRIALPARNDDAAAESTVLLRLELQEALRSLPRRQREALILRYVADMPEADVGRALGIRPGTVKQHLHRGSEAMRALLDPAGG